MFKDLFQDLFKRKKIIGRKIVAGVTLAAFLTVGGFAGYDGNLPAVYADDDSEQAYAELVPSKTFQRYAGDTRYETAVEISKKNWYEAYNVVLARGDDFPDALAGAVMANSAMVQGPLLLTKPNELDPLVLDELKRLNTDTVFILGGTSAVSDEVVKKLRSHGMQVQRIQGQNRYETAANIAATAVENCDRAFLASGNDFADALSISSYAAANGIPLLLTAPDRLPEATSQVLKAMGVTEITLIGGEKAISAKVQEELEKAGYTVERLYGDDRYKTNVTILESLAFDLDQAVVATGTKFPDALAGSVLAARENNPIILVPLNENALQNSPTSAYLNTYREEINNFFILGGWSVINYKVENIIRTGKVNPRVSLQFWSGYALKENYEKYLTHVPEPFTDYIDVLSPNFVGELKSDGSFAYRFANADIPRHLVALGQSKGARVVPLIMGSGKVASDMLKDPAKRQNFVKSALKVVEETKADGIMVDLEALADDTEKGLTSLMRDLYTALNPKGKLVMICVMPKTSPTAEPWLVEYNYKELAKYADYIQIMSYDKHYTTSAPGPIAPLDWVRQVMSYAVTQIPAEKILMGMPYYGRSWWYENGKWNSTAFGWAVATETADEYGATITRGGTSATDPLGVPTFKYVDNQGRNRTAYFDDRLSWGAKLSLLDDFALGGIGGWAMSWINEKSAPELYPLLKERLR